MKGGGMNAFLGIVGVILSFMSLVVALNGDLSNPYIVAALVLVAIVGAFMAGVNAIAAKERLNAFVDEKLEKAASRAVDGKLDDINDMVSKGVFDEINEAIRKLTDDVERDSRANEVLSELRGFTTDEGRRAYIMASGKMDPDDFRNRISLLVERGDITGVQIDAESGGFVFTSEVGIVDEALSHALKRVRELHELHMLDEKALGGDAR